jgi:hypothetical protein
VPAVHFVRTETGLFTAVTAITLFLLLATYEEVGFRGYAMRRLLKVFGMWSTLFIVAAMFVLYHISLGWALPQALIGTGLGSLLFGMAAIAKRQGLAFPIGVHAGWNIATWSVGQQGGVGIWDIWFPPSLSERVHAIGMIAYIASMLLGIAALGFWIKRNAGSINRE